MSRPARPSPFGLGLLLAALLAAFILPAGRAAAEQPAERWYVVSLGGTPVGYYREAVSGSAASGWVTESAMVMVINRLGSRVDLGVSSRTEEGPDGKLRRTASETKASALAMKSEAAIGSGTIEVRSEAGGKSYTRTVPYTGELIGPEAMRRMSLARLKKPGDILEYQTYAGELEKPAKGRRTILGPERIEAGRADDRGAQDGRGTGRDRGKGDRLARRGPRGRPPGDADPVRPGRVYPLDARASPGGGRRRIAVRGALLALDHTDFRSHPPGQDDREPEGPAYPR